MRAIGPIGRIDRLVSFWRRPKYALRCDQHGDLGRFDTQQAATNYWEVHTSVANHTDSSNANNEGDNND